MSYDDFSRFYDRLTDNVEYEKRADYFCRLLSLCGVEGGILLDLGCGTGSMSVKMAEKGFEVIGVDSSVGMLNAAQQKMFECGQHLLLLNQPMQDIDLYGTVDAAICSLDGMNYLPGDTLPELFDRLRLFVRPGGLVIFDIRPADWLRSLDGEIFVDENDDVLCIWRADFDRDEGAIVYGMDIFNRQGKLWRRSSEEHLEYAHSEEYLRAVMEKAGFEDIRFTSDCPQGDAGRVFVVAKRKDM